MNEEYAIHNQMNHAVIELTKDLDGWKTLPIEWSEATGLPTVGLTDESSDTESDAEPVHRITIQAEPDSRYEVTGFSGKMVDGEYEHIHHIAWMSYEDKENSNPPLSGLDAAIDYVRMVCNSAMILTEAQ